MSNAHGLVTRNESLYARWTGVTAASVRILPHCVMSARRRGDAIAAFVICTCAFACA